MLIYGFPAFKKMVKTQFAKLQVAQNEVIKLALNVPWRTSTKQIHSTTNMENSPTSSTEARSTPWSVFKISSIFGPFWERFFNDPKIVQKRY
jgi:hypothetical protein